MKKYIIGALLLSICLHNDAVAGCNPLKDCMGQKKKANSEAHPGIISVPMPVAPPTQPKPEPQPSPVVQPVAQTPPSPVIQPVDPCPHSHSDEQSDDPNFVLLEGHKINKYPRTNQEAQGNVLAALNIAHKPELINTGLFHFYFGYLRLLHAHDNAQRRTSEDRRYEQNLINDTSTPLIGNVGKVIADVRESKENPSSEIPQKKPITVDPEQNHLKLAPITKKNCINPDEGLTNQEAQENLLLLINIACAEGSRDSQFFGHYLHLLDHLHSYHNATNLSAKDRQAEQEIIDYASTQVVRDIHETIRVIDQAAAEQYHE